MTRRSGWRDRVLVAGVVVATLSCGADPLAVELETVREHRARWVSVRPPAYAFTLVRECECPASTVGPVDLTVSGDSVVEMTYGDGTPVPLDLWRLFPTVDQLFDIVDQAIRRGFLVTVIYDEASGVPLSVNLDPDPDLPDDEVVHRVLSLPVPVDPRVAPLGRQTR